jgi:DNA-binding transcriptional LysR family regulator
LLDVRQAFETLEQGFQNLGDLAALRRGKVRIAAAPSVLAVLLLPVLPALRVRHPGIEVDLIEDSAEGIAQRVQAGSVDFGVGAAHPAGGDLLTQPLISDAMGLVARLDEPLLQARRLTAADLARLPHLAFVGLTTDTAISQLLASAPGMPQNLLQTPLRQSAIAVRGRESGPGRQHRSGADGAPPFAGSAGRSGLSPAGRAAHPAPHAADSAPAPCCHRPRNCCSMRWRAGADAGAVRRHHA